MPSTLAALGLVSDPVRDINPWLRYAPGPRSIAALFYSYYERLFSATRPPDYRLRGLPPAAGPRRGQRPRRKAAAPVDGAAPQPGGVLAMRSGQAAALAGITPNCRIMCAMSMYSRSLTIFPELYNC